MKKNLVFFLFSILFLFPIISAVEFQGKTEFQNGGTFFVKIVGNFFEPVSENDIIFLKGHTRISIVPFVERIDGDYYVYAQLFGKGSGNYSLVIENAKISEFGQIIELDLEKNFTISANSSDFSVEPGFISTNESFEVEIQNLKNSEITLSYEIINESEVQEESEDGGFFDFGSFFGNSESSGLDSNGIKIKTGETKKITFQTRDFSSFTIQKILFSTENTDYEMPIFITTEKSGDVSGGKLRFEPSELDVSIGLNSKTDRIVYLFNTDAKEKIENLEISFSDSLKPYMSVSKNNISSISENSSEKIDISFFSGSNEGKVEGQIRAKTQDDFYDYISITLNILKNFNPNQSVDSSTPFCSALNGTICNPSTEKCQDGNTKVARDGICCLSVCTEVVGSSYGKIIGWTIVALILGFVLWFYFFKYKKTKNVVDLLKIARGR